MQNQDVKPPPEYSEKSADLPYPEAQGYNPAYPPGWLPHQVIVGSVYMHNSNYTSNRRIRLAMSYLLNRMIIIMTTNYKAIIQLAAIVTEVRMIGSAQCNLTYIIAYNNHAEKNNETALTAYKPLQHISPYSI